MFNKDFLYIEAILMYVVLTHDTKENFDWNLKEFMLLASSANINIKHIIFSKSKMVHAKYFVGKGKVIEIEKAIYDNSSVSIILFNQVLTASQERNLMSFFKRKVIDRNRLILNIFAQRAKTYEGKLQVQLAQLRYLNSRLTHEWDHLERQKGGIGLRGGPGEMQLEKDRRLLHRKIVQVSSCLKKIESKRAQNRRYRAKMGSPTISLVGYTNAGKSELFNVMTESHVYTSEKLFATLDPVCRRMVCSDGIDLILIDTVGFIQNLPKLLISSFKATLLETMEATVLLHVVDSFSQKIDKNISTVHILLDDMKINNIPTLLVMNKIDLLDGVIPCIDRDVYGKPFRVWISAQKKLGINLLTQALHELLSDFLVTYEFKIPVCHDLCCKLYSSNFVERFWIEDDQNVRFKIRGSYIDWNRFLKKNKSLLHYLV